MGPLPKKEKIRRLRSQIFKSGNSMVFTYKRIYKSNFKVKRIVNKPNKEMRQKDQRLCPQRAMPNRDGRGGFRMG